MGYDYSGGGLSGPDRHMAEAIKMLRAGQTRGQQNRALLDKVLVTGATAGIGAIGHAIEANKSLELQENQHKATIMRDAIDDQSRRAGSEAAQDRLTRASSEQYASPEYTPPSPDDQRYGGAPAWLEDVQGAADTAKQNQRTNASAAGVAIGGYHTPEGAEQSSANANAQFRDIGTSQDMMKMGGMMNSQARR